MNPMNPMNQMNRNVALVLPSLAGGGVEKVGIVLANNLVRRGANVEIVLFENEGVYFNDLPENTAVRILKKENPVKALKPFLSAAEGHVTQRLRTALLGCKHLGGKYVNSMTKYLNEKQPQAVMSGMMIPNVVTAVARQAAQQINTRLILTERSPTSRLIRETIPDVRTAAGLVRSAYQSASNLVTVSNGLVTDLTENLGITHDRITTIYNPIPLDEIRRLAKEKITYDFDLPTILSVGRLTKQKDFGVLIEAFAILRKKRKCRLLILGEGDQRHKLNRLAQSLGVADDVALPGFVRNPFAYMSRAAAFALSSRWEGFGNVLAEAMACGCPVVSTNCPHGPSEILAHGDLGRLVPVGGVRDLAQALHETLNQTHDANRLRQAAQRFNENIAADKYNKLFFP